MKKIFLTTYLTIIVIVSVLLISRIPQAKSVDFDLSRFGISDGFPVESDQGELKLAEKTDVSGFFLSSHLIILAPGDYVFDITYNSNASNKVHFQANNDVFVERELPEGQNTVSIPVTLLTSTVNGKLRFTYNGTGDISIQKITCTSSQLLYTDEIFLLCIFLIINIVMVYLYLNRQKYVITPVKVKVALVLLAVTVLSIPYKALFQNGLYLATDMVFHLSRIESIKDGLLEHQFPVVIYPNMCNEYGSIGTAYPSLFLYFPAFLRILKVSPVCTYKFYTLVVNGFLVGSAFFSTQYISKSKRASMAAAILFAFSFYHLDMVGYKNWTMGMGIATAFVFIIIAGIYDILFLEQKRWYLLLIGMTGIISSHVMTSIMVSAILLVICLIFVRKILDPKRIATMIKTIILAVCVNACTLYMLFDALSNRLNTQKLRWTSFGEGTYSLSEIFTIPINIGTILCLLIVFVYLLAERKNRDSLYQFISSLFAIDLILFLLTTNLLPWTRLLEISWINTVLNYIQFPNRLYVVIAPTLAMTTAMCLFKNLVFNKTLKQIMISLIVLVSIWSYWEACSSYQNGVIAIADSILGDVFSTHSSDDYLPEGADYEWYNNQYPDFSSYDDSIIVTDYIKNGTRIQGLYVCTKDNQYLDMPLFFYKGYRCVDADGNEIELTKGNHEKIRLILEKTDIPQNFTIFYSVPKIYKILFLFSFGCGVGCFIYYWRRQLHRTGFDNCI